MKKGIIVLFALCCMNLLGAEHQNNLGDIHLRMNLIRGEEQFRTNVIHKKIGMAGRSNSSQYIDFVGYADGKYKPDARYTKTKSFMVGTNSNLVKFPDIFAGISLGNFKSHLEAEEGSYKVRSLGFNYFVGYDWKDTLFISKFGYNRSKSWLDNKASKMENWLVDIEAGHLYEVVNEKTRIYPFATFSLRNRKAHGGAGVSLVSVIEEKIEVSTTAKWNLPKGYGEMGVQLGYYIDPELMVTLGYNYLFDRDYNYDLVKIGLTHKF